MVMEAPVTPVQALEQSPAAANRPMAISLAGVDASLKFAGPRAAKFQDPALALTVADSSALAGATGEANGLTAPKSKVPEESVSCMADWFWNVTVWVSEVLAADASNAGDKIPEISTAMRPELMRSFFIGKRFLLARSYYIAVFCFCQCFCVEVQ